MKYALTAVAVAAMASSQAAILIDHFDDPVGGQGVSIVAPPGPVSPVLSTVQTGLANVLGGSRQLYVATTAGGGVGHVDVGANVDPNLFTLAASNVSIDAYGGIIWDADGAGLNADFSGQTLVRFDYDHDQPTTFSLTLFSPGGSHTETISHLGKGFGTDQFSLADFAAAGVDLSDVDVIIFDVDGAGGIDASVHFIEADVPEPAATGVAFAALAGIGMVVRRFRKA